MATASKENAPWPTFTDVVATPPKLEGHKYHVYICTSTNEHDVKTGESLKEKLTKLGFTCCTYNDMFEQTKAQCHVEGISQSKIAVFIITSNMKTSEENWMPFQIVNAQAKSREIQSKVVLFFPILHGVDPNKPEDGVPISIRDLGYLQSSDRDFTRKLVDALTKPKKLRDVLPAGNIGHGLSWSHNNGYMAIVLPELPGATKAQMQSKEDKYKHFSKVKHLDILLKMITIVPATAGCPKQIVAKNMSHVGQVMVKASRAGKAFREYGVNMYRVTDPNKQEEFLMFVEYPAAISILPKMVQGRQSSIDNQHMRDQLKLFKDKLEEIVMHPDNRACNNNALFQFYEDDQQEPEELWKILVGLRQTYKGEMKPIEQL